jgi:hypothetical protein
MTDQKIAEYLLGLLKADGGKVAKSEVTQKVPYLNDVEIARIFAWHAPDVREAIVAGIPCWQQMSLPDNFAEHLGETIASLEEMEFAVSSKNLNLALSLRYGRNFRKTHGLEDDVEFKKFLRVFSPGGATKQSEKQSDEKDTEVTEFGKNRSRSRFDDLGIPIGALLEFEDDTSIVAEIINESNLVEYRGERMTISKLATQLKEQVGKGKPRGSSFNGFSHFLYEGETLWQRRMRMEAEAGQARQPSQSAGAKRMPSQIIGLQGKPLPQKTWRNFLRMWHDPRRAEMAELNAKGVPIAEIARQFGLSETYVECWMLWVHDSMPRILEKNGLTLEDIADA